MNAYPHSRQADWVANLPAEGLREMCTWEQFCRLAREPERRKVGIDARVTVAGTAYEVDPQLQHLNWLTELTQSEIGTWPVKEFPVKFSETPPYITNSSSLRLLPYMIETAAKTNVTKSPT